MVILVPIEIYGIILRSIQRTTVSFGEGILLLLWGIAKTIYNVLGGFYGYYSIMIPQISVHKVHKNCKLFLCTFYSANFSVFLKYRKSCTKDTIISCRVLFFHILLLKLCNNRISCKCFFIKGCDPAQKVLQTLSG